jgi:hypothetical protein
LLLVAVEGVSRPHTAVCSRIFFCDQQISNAIAAALLRSLDRLDIETIVHQRRHGLIASALECAERRPWEAVIAGNLAIARRSRAHGM